MAESSYTAQASPDYRPTEVEQSLIAEVERKFQKWSDDRRPNEGQWYINAAAYRGASKAQWNVSDHRLYVPVVPQQQKRYPINLIFPKFRARIAKMLKDRPKPESLPVTSDIKDRQDARSTTKALEFADRRAGLPQKFEEALVWAGIASHGYWWYHWDPSILGRVSITNPTTGEKIITEAPLGDFVVEVDGPFGTLVADPAVTYIGDQPEIMRLKVRNIEDVRARWPEKGKFVKPELSEEQALRYQKQISALSAANQMGLGGTLEDRPGDKENSPTSVVTKELFSRPCRKYPHGRYVVVANGVLLSEWEQDETEEQDPEAIPDQATGAVPTATVQGDKRMPALPYNFARFTNPYPCTDFIDVAPAGQYWGTTLIEQIIPPQMEYNDLRARLSDHFRMSIHGKLLAAKQHRLAPGVWTNRAGEVVEYIAHPNIPPPMVITPPPISNDVWNGLSILRQEIDSISHIFPEAEGQIGGAESGFQTNLLQEATDAVHAPDMERHKRSLEDAYLKIRQLMKNGYDTPRLITVLGADREPDALEFSSEDINEYADIRVGVGSSLPTGKTARIQAVSELWGTGILGDPANPDDRRRVTGLLELGDMQGVFDTAQKDEEAERIEVTEFDDGKDVPPPDPWENHQVRYQVITDDLKTPGSKRKDPQIRMKKIRHVVQHARFINPQTAIEIATLFGMEDEVMDLLQMQAGQVAPGGAKGPPTGPPPPPSSQPPGQPGPGGPAPSGPPPLPPQ